MDTVTKKFIVTFQATNKIKQPQKLTFFQQAQKHIAKKRKGLTGGLSKSIDKIIYGGR